MVMACCSNCYAKYIDENENLILDELKKIFKGNNVSVYYDEGKDLKCEEYFQGDNEIFKPKKYKILSNYKVIDLCSCICHKKGVLVRH